MDPLIPEIKLELTTTPIKVKPRTLKVKWTFSESAKFVSFYCEPSFLDKFIQMVARITDTIAGPGTWAKILHHTYWRWFPPKYEDELTGSRKGTCAHAARVSKIRHEVLRLRQGR